ncbi:hypothetical protein ADK41_32855 [Streptomyces caelestis]|uniref:Uncharacterized protein n=1 Tax=Streptomyces caelestis TaxID=36816 RepID=A0A0M9X5X1_9ACTN|nr:MULTISPECIES: hypothetical protein [Streptomyces]KOT30391.1 hypothetical protein ADK41_32855 [Streptomyces caelestis]
MHDPADAADGENPPPGEQRPDSSGIRCTPGPGIPRTARTEPVIRYRVGSRRRVREPDAARVKAAHGALVRDASRARPAGRPATEGAP